MDFQFHLLCNILIAFVGFLLSLYLVPKYSSSFGVAQLQGLDINRHGYRLLPEGLGVVTIAVYLVCMLFFVPFAYINDKLAFQCMTSYFFSSENTTLDVAPISSETRLFDFNQKDFAHYMGVLLSISFMALIGFADDVLQLKRRHKIIFPAIATIPLLMIYHASVGSTHVEIPFILQFLYGSMIQFGTAYYVYLVVFVVFCTNSISILSGVNGIEVGQSVIVCLSIILLNLVEMSMPGPCSAHHRFSIFFMIPFAATSLGLLRYDWYPARVFVGDTYCYVAGITFAAVAILGHFTPALFMFLLPQAFNFLYSLPQLLDILPSEEQRRLPDFRHESGLVDVSMVIMEIKNGKVPWVLRFLHDLNLARVEVVKVHRVTFVKFNNLTLNNYVLKVCGPMDEGTLASTLLLIQGICSLISFFILYVTTFVPMAVCGVSLTPKR